MNATGPESEEVIVGLTIDVIKRLLATIKVPRCADNSSSEAAVSSPDGGDWEDLMQITMLPTNPDIFNIIQSDECRPDLHPYRLCIGAAAISMTAERELAMDFLPSYYTSGLHIMAHTASNVSAMALHFIKAAWSILGSIVMFALALIMMLSPLVWWCELMSTPGGDVSIFHTTKAEAPDLTEDQRARKEILAAFVWTATLFSGSAVSKPTSATGKLIRAIGLGAQKAVLLSVFSGVTALLSTGMLQTQIESFSDLAGNTICVNADSTALRWLSANNIGFDLEPSVGVTNMFNNFWLDNCGAFALNIVAFII